MTPRLCTREEGHIWLRYPLGVMSGRDTAEIPGVGRDNWSTGVGRAVTAALCLNADWRPNATLVLYMLAV